MKRPPFELQRFGLKDSAYERPSRTWVCGHAAEGNACQIGPDQGGRCAASFECRPVAREGSWHCSRPALYGGPCQAGPLDQGGCSRPISKCRPVRARRSRLRRASAWMLLLALSAVAIAAAGPWRVEFFSPGALSHGHAAPAVFDPREPLPARGLPCEACHPMAASGPRAWVLAALGQPPARQSESCLKCHPWGASAMKAHGRSPAELAKVSERLRGKPAPPFDEDIRCASCHREHRGAAFDLTAVEDLRCQACHVRRFASLGDGHPEFHGYPYERGTHLRFDHNRHRSENFHERTNRQVERPFECAGCHVPDSAGRGMLLRGFDETCASCHAQQIADNPGLPVLTVPGLDETALADGLDVGRWPNHDDSDVSPFMRLLLAGDDQGAPYLDGLADLDPLDLAGSAPEELAQVAEYAKGVRRLLADLDRGGQAAWSRRVDRALQLAAGSPVGPASGNDLFGQLSADTLRSALRAWFPSTGVPRLEGDPVGLEPQPVSGWFRQDTDFTLRYRPTRHADAFVHDWLELTVRLAPTQPLARALLARLSEDRAPGRCLKCHTRGPEVETQGEGVQSVGPAQAAPERVHWLAKRTMPGERAFTRFSHAPHLGLLGQGQACARCHVLLADAPAQERERAEGLLGSGDFLPVKKALCATCHVRASAGGDCVTCHNYHVGLFPTVPRMPAPDTGDLGRPKDQPGSNKASPPT